MSQGAGTDQQPSITTLELNALRYAAGYIPRALLKKLKKSSHPLNDELQLCLLDLLDDGDEEGGTAEEWLNLIDRGSLKRVNECTFQVMVAMELELRKHLQPQTLCVTSQSTFWRMRMSNSIGASWDVTGERGG